jgi:alkylhydroperoxidase family enzyme
MEPMFLREVEEAEGTGPHGAMIQKLRTAGAKFPQIFHLFAYKSKATDHLSRYTQEVMRGPSPLSPGMRELIAAFTSSENQCPF